MSFLSRLQRNLYFVQRTVGDVEAARKGRLVKRVVRRSVTRRFFKGLGL